MVKKLTIGPLSGFCQAKAVHVVLSNLSAKAPRGHERQVGAVHPLGKSGPSTTNTEGIILACRGDHSRHRDDDRTGVGLPTDQVVDPCLPVLGGGIASCGSAAHPSWEPLWGQQPQCQHVVCQMGPVQQEPPRQWGAGARAAEVPLAEEEDCPVR